MMVNMMEKVLNIVLLMKDKILFKGDFKNNLFIIPDFEIKKLKRHFLQKFLR